MQSGLTFKSWYFALQKKVVAVKARGDSNENGRIQMEQEAELKLSYKIQTSGLCRRKGSWEWSGRYSQLPFLRQCPRPFFNEALSPERRATECRGMCGFFGKNLGGKRILLYLTQL